MSSEVCPFCGKSFKRLKSHLPHCKAAPTNSKTTRHEEPATTAKNKTISSAKTEKSAQKLPLETKTDKQDVKSATRTKTSKKTTMKVSENIKMDVKKSPPAAESSSTSRRKLNIHKSGKNDKESTSNTLKNEEILPESAKETTNAASKRNDKESKIDKPDFEKLISIPGAKKPTKSTIEKKSLDSLQNAKQTKKKEVTDILTNKTSSTKPKITVNNVTNNFRDNSWPEDKNDVKSLPEIDPWSKRETKITLEDVRTTLRRAKQNGDSKKNNLVASDESKCEIINQNTAKKSLVKAQKEPPSQLMALDSSKNEMTASKSEDFMSKLSKMENKDCIFTHRSETLRDALRMDQHSMGLTSAVSGSVKTFLDAEVSTEVFRKDLVPVLKQNVEKNAKETEETTRDVKKQDQSSRALAQQRLGQVTLRELPDWLVLKSPRRPRDVVDMTRRGWQWYYRRYIDVKRGGVGGVAMLLAGYCVLSYVWTYPHLKRDRWRKYH